jgi:hypothetical protein
MSETDVIQLANKRRQRQARALIDVHDTFRRWFGPTYDMDVIDAVLTAAAAERLPGDALWLLVISGPGNAKTESVQCLSGTGAFIISTIQSEGALLSASPAQSRSPNATGGLLRRVGLHGLIVIKDFTSILSSDRNVRAGVLAALREVHDGRWERNVGSDGGRTLLWEGRIAIIGAVTTAWDAAHAVVSTMGDRFVLIRSDSTTGRTEAGMQAIRNTGREKEMRADLERVVGALIREVRAEAVGPLSEDEIERLIRVANVATLARTAVERDFKGDVIDAHAPEAPTRFSKQLSMMVRGGWAIGMEREAAMRLGARCARDSIPPLRLAVLRELARRPGLKATEVAQNITKPVRTVRRELEALHVLGLLRGAGRPTWYSLSDAIDRTTLHAMTSCQKCE